MFAASTGDTWRIAHQSYGNLIVLLDCLRSIEIHSGKIEIYRLWLYIISLRVASSNPFSTLLELLPSGKKLTAPWAWGATARNHKYQCLWKGTCGYGLGKWRVHTPISPVPPKYFIPNWPHENCLFASLDQYIYIYICTYHVKFQRNIGSRVGTCWHIYTYTSASRSISPNAGLTSWWRDRTLSKRDCYHDLSTKI